jgi:hypothetical protein
MRWNLPYAGDRTAQAGQPLGHAASYRTVNYVIDRCQKSSYIIGLLGIAENHVKWRSRGPKAKFPNRWRNHDRRTLRSVCKLTGESRAKDKLFVELVRIAGNQQSDPKLTAANGVQSVLPKLAAQAK